MQRGTGVNDNYLDSLALRDGERLGILHRLKDCVVYWVHRGNKRRRSQSHVTVSRRDQELAVREAGPSPVWPKALKRVRTAGSALSPWDKQQSA